MVWRLSPRIARMVAAREIAEGAKLPSGYGVAWWLPYSHVAYCLPIPLNKIAGAFRGWWLSWRLPVEDDPIANAYQYGKSRGFAEGNKHGYETGMRHAAIVREALK